MLPIDELVQRAQLSSRQILELYGDSLSCNDIIAILPLLSIQAREEVKEGIYKRQQAFWDSPEQVKYYAELHPQLPPVPGHFKHLVESIVPGDGEVVVDLGCGCGALMQALLQENKEVRVIGIDYAPNVLKMVPRLVPNLGDGQVTLVNHDLRRGIPLPDGSQTKVVSNWGVANLLPDDLQRSFSEVYRVLQSGGRFVCSALVTGEKLTAGAFLKSAPNKLHFLWEMMQKYRKGVIQAAERFAADLRRFFPVYSPEELVEMMEKAGLRAQQQEFTLMGKSVTIVAQKGGFEGGCL